MTATPASTLAATGGEACDRARLADLYCRPADPPPPDETDIATLRVYVRAPGNGSDDTFLTEVLLEATALVAERIHGANVPPVISNLAVREVAADLYHRRRVRNGIAQFDGADLAPVRVTRDPMKAAADILAPFLTPGIG